jgi:hypothetical protein
MFGEGAITLGRCPFVRSWSRRRARVELESQIMGERVHDDGRAGAARVIPHR